MSMAKQTSSINTARKKTDITPIILALGGLINLALIVVIGVIALSILGKTDQAMQEATAVTHVLRSHMQADMMHDAIRGDVLNAFHGARSGDKEAAKQIAADVTEHADSIVNSEAEVRAASLPPELAAEAVAAEKEVINYVENGKRMVTSIFVHPDEAEKDYTAFRKQFDILEASLGAISDGVEKRAATVEQAARETMHNSHSRIMTVIGAIALFNTIMIGVSQFLMRRVRRRNEEIRREALCAIADTFDRSVRSIVENVGNAAQQLQTAARGLAGVAKDATHQSQQVTHITEQTAGKVSTIASAAEELSASISTIGEQTTRSSEVVKNAVMQTQHSSGLIESLAASATAIGDVVQLIQSIASKTNLLALNATIEAARAGETGRGFAVVAAEVKGLAGQTARATQDIEEKVRQIMEASQKAVQAMAEIREVIVTIDSGTVNIASAVEQQGLATREISGTVQQTAGATNEALGQARSMTKAAEQTGQQAEHMLSTSEGLLKQSSMLEESVGLFLREIKNA